MKSKVTVAHIVDKFSVKGASVHGVARLFSWWMPRFDRQCFKVHLVGLREADEGFATLARQGIEVSALGKGKFDFSTIRAIKRLIREWDVDVAHLHGYGAANFGRIAARQAGARAIVHEHFVDPGLPFYQRPFDRTLAGFADLGIANCRSVKEFMVKRRFFAEGKVRVVYNGAPLEHFQPASCEQVRVQKGKWNLPATSKIVATIGRLDEQKGNRYFLEAAAAVLKRRSDAAFLLIGDGPLQGELLEQCRGLGIEGQVVFAGFHDDIALALSTIDMLVIPSLWEGTTLTVFEAMAMQRPIISTDVDGLCEILDHEKNALLVPPRNGRHLARAIEDLLANPDKAARLARQAKQDSRNFDIQKTVEEVQQIYRELVASG